MKINKYVKSFFLRATVFGGFGPIILGIVYFVISCFEDLTLSANEVFLGIISTYILAFLHAGASVFNQIEEWPLAKSLLFHFLSLYVAYSVCYLVNSWIEFNIIAFICFTLVFVLVYFAVWLTVVICVKLATKKINQNINESQIFQKEEKEEV